MRSDHQFARSALVHHHIWSPRENFQASRWAAAAPPVGIPVQHFNLLDAGSGVGYIVTLTDVGADGQQLTLTPSGAPAVVFELDNNAAITGDVLVDITANVTATDTATDVETAITGEIGVSLPATVAVVRVGAALYISGAVPTSTSTTFSIVSLTGGVGSLEFRTAPWVYRFDDFPGSLHDGGAGSSSLGKALRAAPEVLWLGDLVIHVKDAAGSGANLVLRIQGWSATHQELEEKISITTAGANTYVRTKFAYSRLRQIKIEAISGFTQFDYIEIGHDLENGTEASVKIGIPFGIESILDLAAIKADITPTATKATAAMPNNTRGYHAIDLVRGGAVFDPRDNALRVNTCTELTRPHLINGTPAVFTLAAAPKKSRHSIIFQVDPRNPTGIRKPGAKVFLES